MKLVNFYNSVYILAAAVAIASSIATNVKNAYIVKKTINEMVIGTSQDYIFDKLGSPNYKKTYDDNGVTECVHVTNWAFLREFYIDESLIGYFVTSRNQNTRGIGTNNIASRFTNNKTLGKYTYKEIEGKPNALLSFASNGSGNTVYSEEYYYASSGNYYIYYYMYLMYGFDSNKYISEKEYYTDEEVNSVMEDNNQIYMVCVDREKSYPNTYGVCIGEYDDEIMYCMTLYGQYDFTGYICK